ncbi:MAG TPA: 2Fe-2S iron-sulfur cluster-binding protein [Chitinophagaceae bacterium]|nr:2Fe-2S iron-sulfur cluster-binding protein [Chitinophagaceae bacterium]
MIRFILNEKEISTDFPPGMVLLDFIRYHQHLTGTKIGCREGDCGACTILVGEIKEDKLRYKSMTCCLMPLGNANHKHIVTIEGINPAATGELNPVQQAMADAGATQCGFCTPGFVMSLAGFCLSHKEITQQNAIAAIDGNICRCTGYKSIERAAENISEIMKERKDEDATQFVAKKKILPGYFASVKEKLSSLITKTDGELYAEKETNQLVGGGTDLYVQKHDELKDEAIRFMFDQPGLNDITKEENKCIVGPSATVSDLKESPIFNKLFPEFHRYAKLVSSTPIRNMATIAGNFVNASPIGDFTIFFLALDAQLIMKDLTPNPSPGERGFRTLPLRKLYKGYKQLDKTPDEYIEKIWFELPDENTLFNFEKVSKRTHLDIASVNTAILISMNGKNIADAGISAGGVGPIPMYLQKTSEFLNRKSVSEELVYEAIEIAQSEISPISDTRGAKEYKRLLLGQLIKAHFITLFPELRTEMLMSP